MGLGVVTSFSTPASGTCVYCRRSRLVIQPVEGEAGVCDVCSYALRGAWQEAQGERLLATSPRLVKTYVLVPRLKKDRSFLDVSSYEILLDGRGQLPSVDYARSGGDLQSWLRSIYQVVTWEGADEAVLPRLRRPRRLLRGGALSGPGGRCRGEADGGRSSGRSPTSSTTRLLTLASTSA